MKAVTKLVTLGGVLIVDKKQIIFVKKQNYQFVHWSVNSNLIKKKKLFKITFRVEKKFLIMTFNLMIIILVHFRDL